MSIVMLSEGFRLTEQRVVNSQIGSYVQLNTRQQKYALTLGRPAPLRQWWIPPVSDFPPISENFSDSIEIFSNLTLPKQNIRFSSDTISDENYYSTLHFEMCPLILKIYVFLLTLRVFRFPPTLTMMHLRITQCTYWTPLHWHSSYATNLTIFEHATHLITFLTQQPNQTTDAGILQKLPGIGLRLSNTRKNFRLHLQNANALFLPLPVTALKNAIMAYCIQVETSVDCSFTTISYLRRSKERPSPPELFISPSSRSDINALPFAIFAFEVQRAKRMLCARWRRRY